MIKASQKILSAKDICTLGLGSDQDTSDPDHPPQPIIGYCSFPVAATLNKSRNDPSKQNPHNNCQTNFILLSFPTKMLFHKLT